MTDLDADWGLGPNVAARLLRASAWPDPVLTAAERARMATFGSPTRQQQFALGRTAARTLAGDLLDLGPEAVVVGVADDGAPTLPGRHLSIAHTGRGGEVVAVAAVARGPVGVDLERIDRRRPDLWRRILTPDEHALLDALGGPTDEVQTLLWTLKEAVLKGQRTGFRAGGRSVRIGLFGDGAAPDRGHAVAEADQSGRWSLAFGRDGDLWLAVAWQDG